MPMQVTPQIAQINFNSLLINQYIVVNELPRQRFSSTMV